MVRFTQAATVSDATSDEGPLPPPPARVGDYRVCEMLARGGFGAVYRGEHVEHGAEVALKLLRPELTADATLVRRFEQEVEVLRRLSHPGIVAIADLGRAEDGRPYFVMELLRGETLQEALQKAGRLSVAESLAILGALADALGVAHASAVIHRDVKASNVFLAEADGGRRIVLLDFGVAKLLDADGPGITASRHLVGTIASMAPEQIVCGPVDARTDVYALGVLAYQMLTGTPPFEAASLAALCDLHLFGRPARPSSRAPVSPALDEVILRAMAKAREARPPSAAAFLDDLRAAAAAGHGSEEREDEERHVIAVRFEGRIDGDVAADDEGAFADLDRLAPAAARALRDVGLGVTMDAGTTLLSAAARPEDPALDLALRRRVVRAVADLARDLEARPDRDPRVQAHLWVHVGTLRCTRDGTAVGGELMDFASWVPEPASASTILASRAALEGIEADAARPGEGDEAGFVRLDPAARPG